MILVFFLVFDKFSLTLNFFFSHSLYQYSYQNGMDFSISVKKFMWLLFVRSNFQNGAWEKYISNCSLYCLTIRFSLGLNFLIILSNNQKVSFTQVNLSNRNLKRNYFLQFWSELRKENSRRNESPPRYYQQSPTRISFFFSTLND